MIGVFDSGIGGLSVVKQIIATLPNENIVYFGDIARIPYGTKSVKMINQFTSETVQFLLQKNVKALVIACNTITAVAYDTVKMLAKHIPVIDVISSGVQDVIQRSLETVGVIATPATINSNAYLNSLKAQNPDIQVISQPCPLFVPMIEEGLAHDHPALKAIAIEYLNPFTTTRIDGLILGCTHYPLIKDTLQQIIGKNIPIIDPAIQTSINLKQALIDNNLLSPNNNSPQYSFYITDNLVKFRQLSELFLGIKLQHIELVSLS